MHNKTRHKVWQLQKHDAWCKFCKAPAQFKAEDKHWIKFNICSQCKDDLFVEFEAGGWQVLKTYY